MRTPREEVYGKVMQDFDKAIEYLPKSWSASEYGRVTKGAALAMKARAALYYGKWDVAAESAKKQMILRFFLMMKQEIERRNKSRTLLLDKKSDRIDGTGRSFIQPFSANKTDADPASAGAFRLPR